MRLRVFGWRASPLLVVLVVFGVAITLDIFEEWLLFVQAM